MALTDVFLSHPLPFCAPQDAGDGDHIEIGKLAEELMQNNKLAAEHSSTAAALFLSQQHSMAVGQLASAMELAAQNVEIESRECMRRLARSVRCAAWLNSTCAGLG